MENQGISEVGNSNDNDPVFVPTHLSGLKVRRSNIPSKPPVAPSPIKEDDENIPMELSVASVASAAMAVMPEEPAEFGVAPAAAGVAVVFGLFALAFTFNI